MESRLAASTPRGGSCLSSGLQAKKVGEIHEDDLESEV